MPINSEKPNGKAAVETKTGRPRPNQAWPLQDLFLNRELTWLSYNERVLSEAGNQDNPLLERVRFLTIASANLDNFFMKRIGGLKQQICAGVREPSADGLMPRQQLTGCLAKIASFETLRESCWQELAAQLAREGIEIVTLDSLSPPTRAELGQRFRDTIYPLLTPQSIDPAHPFPFISNQSLNLLVSLRYNRRGETTLARVKVPVAPDTPRLVPCGEGNRYVLLEELVRGNLDLLFPGMQVADCTLFRVIRNANSVKNAEEADDLVAVIETELKERRFAPIVRLEVARDMPPVLKGRLAAELEIDENSDVHQTEAMLGMSDLKELLRLEIPALLFPPHHPVDHAHLQQGQSIFQVIRDAGALLLQHPFESFSTSVERFLREAAVDPDVRAIKMTLYRTTRESSFIEALVQAAQNGKQVAVVVELKARFDEAENIRLAEMMNSAGIHVSYGVVGFKTYCKAILVVRQDHDGLRRYVHVGTGNYHPLTARFYCDIGLLSADDAVGQDLTELFNYLTTGINPRRRYQKLLVAPHRLKKVLLEKIRREGELHSRLGGGLIRFKMNALEDPDIVKALYEASGRGVRIELTVRDSCRLRPGVEGLSDNISVVSIVGRFVEHSRIYHFRNGGKDQYYLGSADAMKSNLETRVEVLCPVEAPHLQRELNDLLDLCRDDNWSAWDMSSDGSYAKRRPEGDAAAAGSQQLLGELARVRAAASTRSKKKRKAEPDGAQA
ncbi:polyphosphate kinase 1 [Geobacter sp. SVR]|uniref:polyphosphate kinase 1 n=1 Tax=Geobacter sp. SVR TaxID=2495594 RepID=UPI00143EF529|nr:polyphosphate kinase 1 [Geobacter sp. SVR]BCS53368.1 polyphosphate kinase [Geobacter sp. SVR]GCF85506.1 polyphosphate kinase [Geobacter sp. SVR]